MISKRNKKTVGHRAVDYLFRSPLMVNGFAVKLRSVRFICVHVCDRAIR
jgi:hypothetical protein